MLQEVVDNSSDVLLSLTGLYSQEELCDLVLQVGTRQYKTHKLVLCMRSDVLKTMLTSSAWPESRSRTVVLQEESDCEAVFEDFLKYLYSGRVCLNGSSVLALLMLGDKYNVPDLSNSCLHFISSNCRPESRKYIVAWLEYAFLCDNSEVERICLSYIINNFDSMISTKEFLNLSKDILVKLLESSELVINNEYHLYKAVTKWLLQNQNSYADYDIFSDIMQYIRFPMMQLQQLSDLETDQFVQSRENFFLQRIFTAVKYHTSKSRVARQRLLASSSFNHHFDPRNYDNETWSTTVTVEDYKSRNPGDVWGAFFTTPISFSEMDQHNLRDWHIHLYPKGIKYDPCIMINVPSSITVDASFERNIRLSVTANVEVRQRVEITILVIADWQGQDEFVCKVLTTGAIFDAKSTMFNMNDIVPYEELVCPDSRYLVSKYDQFKLIVIIKPDPL